VGLRCARVGNSSMRFEAGIFRGDAVLVTGELIYVFADPTNQTSRPVPDALRSILESYEAGETLTDVRVGSWGTHQAHASTLRDEVFVQEQGIAAPLVWDTADAGATHAVVLNRLGQPVASGRLVQEAGATGRIGRMAVKRALRGASLGRDVLLALVQVSRERGDHAVTLHAQCSAEGFYQRLGFQPRGDVFEEAGIAHREMVLPL